MPLIEVQGHFVCSITHELMQDPVITCGGQTYERAAIAKWLNTHNTDPLSNEVLKNKNLIPNVLIRKLISDFKEEKKFCTPEQFLAAVRDNKVHELENTINYYSYHLDYKDSKNDNRTAAHIAAELGHLQVVQLLMKDNANLEVEDSMGNHPLHLACANGHQEVAKFLVVKKCNFQSANREGFQPAHYAVQKNLIQLIPVMLAIGFDQKSRIMPEKIPKITDGYSLPIDEIGATGTSYYGSKSYSKPLTNRPFPLGNTGPSYYGSMSAKEQPSDTPYQYILSPERNNIAYYKTCIHLAAEAGHAEVLKLLLAKPDAKNQTDSKTQVNAIEANNYWQATENDKKYNLPSPLLLAIRSGHLAIVKFFIENIPGLLEKEPYAMTVACEHRQSEIVAFLIQSGFSVNGPGTQKCSPLYVSIHQLDFNTIKLLIESKADLRVHDNEYVTSLNLVLSKAYQYKNLEYLENTRFNPQKRPVVESNLIKVNEIAKLLLNQELKKDFLEAKTMFSAGVTALHLASYDDRLEPVVQLLITKNVDINVKSCFDLDPQSLYFCSYAPLHIAVTNNSYKVAHTLIEAKADVNLSSGQDALPLHLVNSVAMLEMLLAAKADVQVLDVQVLTDTLFSTMRGLSLAYNSTHFSPTDEEFIQALLTHKANIHGVRDDGRTVLHYNNEGSVIKLLLDGKAQVNAKDKELRTPIFNALIYKNAEKFQMLIEAKADLNCLDNEGNNLLHFAYDRPTVNVLTAHGLNCNTQNQRGITPLQVACGKPSAEMVDALLEAKADINISDNEGHTPLHHLSLGASSRYKINTDDLAIFKTLLAAKANINAISKLQHTMLHILLRDLKNGWPNLSLVKMVLDAKANVNACDFEKNTALHYASVSVLESDLQPVSLLLDAGAVRTASGTNGLKPLDFAASVNNVKAVELLLFKTSTDSMAVYKRFRSDIVIQNEPLKFIKFVASHKPHAYPFTINDLFRTLCIACDSGFYEIALLLLGLAPELLNMRMVGGVDNEMKGRTPLHFICEHGRDALLRVVMDMDKEGLIKNFDVNIKDEKGNTPLLLAAKNGHATIVQHLVEIILKKLSEQSDDLFDINRSMRAAIQQPRNLRKNYLQILQQMQLQILQQMQQALLLAASNGHVDLITLFLGINHKIKLETNELLEINPKLLLAETKEESDHPLCAAARGGHAEAIKILYPHYLKNKNSKTTEEKALRAAVTQDHDAVVKVFIEAKADISIKDEKQQTLLHLAATAGAKKVAGLLISQVNAEAKQGFTPLMLACSEGYDSLVEVLVQAKADIHKQVLQQTALHYAALGKNFYPIARILLEAKANPEVQNSGGDTPMHCVASHAGKGIKLLFDAKADCSARNALGNTPFHQASSTTVVQELLMCQADPEIENNHGQTALHCLAQNGNTPVVRLLLEHGVNHQALDHECRTPLELARKQKAQEVAALLQAHHCRFIKTTFEAPKEIARLQAVVQRQDQRITELEERLNKKAP